MKLTNRQIEALDRSIDLKNLISSPTIPIKLSFRLSLFLQKFSPVAQALREAKQKLYGKLCDRDNEGKPIVTNNMYTFTTKGKEFVKEMAELDEQEVDIESGPIEVFIEDLPDGVLSAEGLFRLKDIIDFKEKEVPSPKTKKKTIAKRPKT